MNLGGHDVTLSELAGSAAFSAALGPEPQASPIIVSGDATATIESARTEGGRTVVLVADGKRAAIPGTPSRSCGRTRMKGSWP